MKDIYTIYEGLLAGQNNTMQASEEIINITNSEFEHLQKYISDRKNWEKDHIFCLSAMTILHIIHVSHGDHVNNFLNYILMKMRYFC